MQYISTRNAEIRVPAARAIVQGISAEGGLFAPEAFPTVSLEEVGALAPLAYPARAARILAGWLSDFDPATIGSLCEAAYTRFDTPAIAPVRVLGGDRAILELWHGPTLAFKDMALQLLPLLMTESSRLLGERREILILVATSGDTGKAALEGFRDREGVRICVFYPENGVSQAQRLQMVTQEGSNVRVVAVRGNFDDAQTGVKKIFTDPDIGQELARRGIVFSSANSINLGRLVPQIAYYFSGYCDMIQNRVVNLGDKIDVAVPTGNFGNILAAYYAREMGLPIRRLICASNANHVLTDFLRTGLYDRNRPFHLTTSPSMDILISSNLERLLFHLTGGDDGRVRGWMDDLRVHGRYRLDPTTLEAMQAIFWGGWADEAEVRSTIGQTFRREGYVLDPHTAVAVCCADKYREACGDAVPMLIASTASPFKFSRAVLEAVEGAKSELSDAACEERLAGISGLSIPEAIARLREKPVLHTAVSDRETLWESVLPLIGG